MSNLLHIVQGDYGSGWEDLTAATSKGEALADLRDYDDNEPYPHRLIRRRTGSPKYSDADA